jgi:hypothetical protein
VAVAVGRLNEAVKHPSQHPVPAAELIAVGYAHLTSWHYLLDILLWQYRGSKVFDGKAENCA